jgi:H+/Cl- antiporter ClcA
VRLAARLLVVLVAYLASCGVAGLFMSLLWSTEETGAAGEIVYRIFARAIAFGMFVATGSLPVIAVIAYAEYMRERRYAFYAVCGLLAGLLPVLVTAPPDAGRFSMDGVVVLTLAGVTGLLAASAYWLIAGRNAGMSAMAMTD